MSNSPDPKHIKQVAAKGIKALGNISIGKIVQIANQIQVSFDFGNWIPISKSTLKKVLLGIVGLGATGVLIISIFFIIHPDRYYALQGFLLLAGKQYDEANAAFDKAIEMRPDSGSGWGGRIWLQGELKQYNEALNSLDKFIKVTPNIDKLDNLWELWGWRGFLLYKVKRFDEALIYLDKSLEQKPNNHKYLFLRAVVLEALQRDKEAIDALEKAIKVKPNFSDNWELKRMILIKLKRYNEALDSANKAIQLEPNSADNWGERAIILMNLGRGDEAVKSFRKAIQIDPLYESGSN
jgi:tetratricopeptide (TPR) repeat protein